MHKKATQLCPTLNKARPTFCVPAYKFNKHNITKYETAHEPLLLDSPVQIKLLKSSKLIENSFN